MHCTHSHFHTVKGAAAGSSPGYGVSLVAESTEGCIYGVDAVALPAQLPEDVGVRYVHTHNAGLMCMYVYVCMHINASML